MAMLLMVAFTFACNEKAAKKSEEKVKKETVEKKEQAQEVVDTLSVKAEEAKEDVKKEVEKTEKK